MRVTIGRDVTNQIVIDDPMVSRVHAAILLTEGAIVSDETDARRPQRTVLRDYIAETVRRAGDAGIRAVPAQHYPGDACNPHPTREQHAAMARDLEPAIRAATGWR